MNFNQLCFKYGIYYPIVTLRGERVSTCIHSLKKSQFKSSEELGRLQLQKLNLLLSHAKSAVPYYRDTLPYSHLNDLDELSKIPLIDKSILRENLQRFLDPNVSRGLTHKTTGGSTGAPVTVAKSKASMTQELAAAWRGYSWAGVDIGDKQGRFWGVPHSAKARMRAKLIDFMGNRYRCSAFSFDDEDLERYYHKLKRFNPAYFYGYVSMLVQFGEFIKKNYGKSPYELKCIITTAEMLTDKDAKLLKDIFRCSIYDEYGCGEIGTIAHQCEHGALHINDENVIVEILDEDGKPVGNGESGEIVVTELNNFAMPLIRYRLVDYGIFSPYPCVCGRGLKVLREVLGREYDFLINSQNKKFHGEFFLYMVEDFKKDGYIVNGVQFIQLSPQTLKINIVASQNVYEQLKVYLGEKINKEFDAGVELKFELVENILREKSGKLSVVKRLVF